MPGISAYSFGRITIEGVENTSDVIILPGRVLASWRRLQGHLLQPADLTAVVAQRPRLLIVGTGNSGVMKIAPQTVEFLRAEGIQMEAMRTAEAVAEYNRQAAGGATAALHLTC